MTHRYQAPGQFFGSITASNAVGQLTVRFMGLAQHAILRCRTQVGAKSTNGSRVVVQTSLKETTAISGQIYLPAGLTASVASHWQFKIATATAAAGRRGDSGGRGWSPDSGGSGVRNIMSYTGRTQYLFSSPGE